MSFGKMHKFIDLLSDTPVKDAAGFVTKGETILASVRAYKEEQHGSESWKNRAVFSSATALFRFRRIPEIAINTTMLIACDADRYRIVSVEDVKGRSMYWEVLCEKVVPGG
ncbi:MAG: head-tail adaptor protein [Saccharofermentanales bacterium]